jgi:hypothetical protein
LHARIGLREVRYDGQSTPSSQASQALQQGALACARVESYDATTARAVVRVGSRTDAALLDDAVDVAVIETAIARGERVLVERLEHGADQGANDGASHVANDGAGAAWTILGALRTAATPGVDEGDEFVIRARRVQVRAQEGIALIAGAAQVLLRARGYVETLAHAITSRASGVQKIIGRAIQLN